MARSVIVELGDALVAVTQGGPGGHRTDPSRRADVDRLAVLLAGSLGQAGGPPDARRDVVSALAGALAGGPDRAALDAALARVHEALRAAGVAGPDAILIDAQMRRVIVGP
ncbi:MAG: hypothetical protein HYR86_12740 [Candidatus Rokubacteria bacterium]|nr:hypothetical protein [Candidatus Rokubacteria bacterium]